jgi:threonine dehydrogenase-like Zn-dependent dehydrogenase
MSHPPVATLQDPWTKSRHADLFFSYLEQGRLEVDDLFSHVEPAESAPELYQSLLEDRTDAMAVRLDW